MQHIFFVLACLVCECHGRRVGVAHRVHERPYEQRQSKGTVDKFNQLQSNRQIGATDVLGMFLLVGGRVAGFSVPPLRRGAARLHSRRSTLVPRLSLRDGDAPQTMTVKQLKAELKEKRIDFSDCFDKQGLVEKLVQARDGLIGSTPAPAHTEAEASVPTPQGVSADMDRENVKADVVKMRAAQIKTELKERRIGFADCFDKDDIVEKLVQARLGLISAPPIPTPSPQPVPTPSPPPAQTPGRAAKKGQVPFGQATRRYKEDIPLDDAFKAAGWTGEEKADPSRVDQRRTPGMNRDFSNVGQDDFKKPYGAGRKSRYG